MNKVTPQDVAKLCKETTLNEVLSWVTNFNAMTGADVSPHAVVVELNMAGANIETTYHKQYLSMTLHGAENGELSGSVSTTFDIAIPDTMDPDDYLKRLHAAIETMRYPKIQKTRSRKFRRRKWTTEEDAFFATSMTMKEISKLVNRSEAAVMSRRWQLNHDAEKGTA